MTTQSIILPYARVSPVRIPRRDLVLGVPDSLALNVTIIEADDPNAPPIEISGGIGGSLLSLFIWPWDCFRHSWDYGAPWMTPGSPLWSGDFIVTDAASATFAISFPPGTMAMWPRRACWSMQLAEDHGDAVTMLAWGNLHVMTSGQRLVQPTPIITNPDNSAILVA